MTHFQSQFKCGVCDREFIVDIISYGVPHETIKAITCLKCAQKSGGKIMKPDEVENLEFAPSTATNHGTY